MKRFIYFTVFFILLFLFSIFMINPDQKAQTTKEQSGSTVRASKGDTVWVLLNHIKADKCEQFEEFVHEILWPIALKLEPADQQVAKQTRVLHPVGMNKDSTYTYVFLMDPVIPGASYEVMYYLKKGYGEEKAKEYSKMFEECYASPQVGYTLIQSQH
jgi:hypothetical protein